MLREYFITLRQPILSIWKLQSCEWLQCAHQFFICCNSYDDNRNEFQARVKQSIERCRQEVLNPHADDPHSIKFAEWNTDVIKAASSTIFESESNDAIEGEPVNAQISGLSWVKKGTTEPFSKP